jgi:hypothetical protein
MEGGLAQAEGVTAAEEAEAELKQQQQHKETQMKLKLKQLKLKRQQDKDIMMAESAGIPAAEARALLSAPGLGGPQGGGLHRSYAGPTNTFGEGIPSLPEPELETPDRTSVWVASSQGTVDATDSIEKQLASEVALRKSLEAELASVRSGSPSVGRSQSIIGQDQDPDPDQDRGQDDQCDPLGDGDSTLLPAGIEHPDCFASSQEEREKDQLLTPFAMADCTFIVRGIADRCGGEWL